MAKSLAEAEVEHRTAVCFKACEGIPTALLEDGFFTRLLAAYVSVRDPRDREVLDLLAPGIDRRGRLQRQQSLSARARSKPVRLEPVRAVLPGSRGPIGTESLSENSSPHVTEGRAERGPVVARTRVFQRSSR